MNALLATTVSAHAVRDDLPKGELTEAIALMDMIPIKDKLIERATSGREKDNPPVKLEDIDEAIMDYRRYLFLNLRYPGFPIAPSYDIDEVWHQHILFTRRYGTDCQKIFGEMRHHIPHFGRKDRRVEEDKRILDKTRALWEAEFGFIPKSYEGMTALTSDNGWSGNVDLTE